MDKRFLLAIILSFMVLYAWAGLNQSQQRQKEPDQFPQLTDNKEDIIISSQPLFALPSKEKPIEVKTEIKVIEKIVTLESEKLRVDFTNLGGNIKNVFIKDYNHTLPIHNYSNLSGYENMPFSLEGSYGNEIRFSYSDGNFQINKKYTISEEEYTIIADIEVMNISEMSKIVNLNIDNIIIDLSNLLYNSYLDSIQYI